MVLGLVSSADGIPQFRVLPSALRDCGFCDLVEKIVELLASTCSSSSDEEGQIICLSSHPVSSCGNVRDGIKS